MCSCAAEILSVALLVVALSGNCFAPSCPFNTVPMGNPDTGVMYAEKNQNFRLQCRSIDEPIAWYRNNIPIDIDGSSSRVSINSDGELVFSRIAVSQAGWYTCATNNSLERREEDFLVIVGDKAVPKSPGMTSYQVIGGSRVELACLSTNIPLPLPQITWKDGFDNPVVEGGKYSIDPTSGSLIITDYRIEEADMGGFFCEKNNEYGCKRTSRIDVGLTNPAISQGLPMPYQSPLDQLSTPLYIPPNKNQDKELTCTGLIMNNNLTIQWFKDLASINNPNSNPDIFVIRANPVPDPNDSGFYCCNVLLNGDPINRHCITVWIGAEPSFAPVLPASFIQLPSYSNRRVQLMCLASSLGYDEPLVNIAYNGSSFNSSHRLNFATVGNLTSADSGGSFTCTLSNSVNTAEFQMQVDVVDVCDGENLVLGGTGDPHSAWKLDGGASFASVNRETVLKLNYTDFNGGFSQQLNTTQAVVVHVSGRIRQISANGTNRGIATIRLNASGSVHTIKHPSASEAWQWVGQTVTFSAPSDQIILDLVVLPVDQEQISGTAFFDNLCVSVITSASAVYFVPIIGGSIGGFAIVLLVLVVTLCLIICLCPKKKQTGMMKKMSLKVNKTFSLQRIRYNAGPSTVSAFNSPPPTVDPPVLMSAQIEQSEAVYETPNMSPRPDTDYINPENYQYINQLGRASEATGYKALDLKTIEDHTYTATTTPISHRSTASLNIVDQSGTEYMEVGSPYLTILPSSVPDSTTIQDSEQYSRVRSATVPVILDTQTELYANAN